MTGKDLKFRDVKLHSRQKERESVYGISDKRQKINLGENY